ncbi:phosphoethanolamine--lipid A transferase [Pseudoalteromonas tunicata]|uniref:phosphoethanolamine transferase n=1 Tax=Pseudoalteromonas tunicata TaxID=314281 RepID=UPI00274029B2|nr:phosphoethanolamine--lipid A transferase [Pseudoalteromonas tunicata]MDP5213886.1 phosphoethanolamine--lipid A transferase [Pseudoalteromonas tunicata]
MLMLVFPRFQCTFKSLIILISVYFTFVFNFPFLKRIMGAVTALPDYNVLFLITIPVFVFLLLLIFFTLISNKWFFKPLSIVLILLSSMVFYAGQNYGVVFDYGMMQNIFETDTSEAHTYLNQSAVLSFLLSGLLPAFLVYRVQLQHKGFVVELKNRAMLLLIAFIGIVVIAVSFYSNFASVGRNNKELKKFLVPSQFLDSSIKYVARTYLQTPPVFEVLDAKPTLIDKTKKQVFVLVVGETARAESFSSNGYERSTNRYTEPLNMTAYQHVSSCGTATAVSVPCMFSVLNREDFDNKTAANEQNVLDIIQQAGVEVIWIDNNSGCKGVCERVQHEKIDHTQHNDMCDGEYCFDEALISVLRNKINKVKSDKVLIVMHMMGSHGPTYYRRYPKAHQLFTPDCPRSDIQNCTKEQLINTYDNTIAYTDFVLAQSIAELNKLPEEISIGLLYVSDHGESLGEMGAYLHGFPYSLAPSQQTHVPLLTWFKQSDIDPVCQNNLADTVEFSHDNLFHSMLGIMGVNTKAYNQQLDMFNICIKPS